MNNANMPAMPLGEGAVNISNTNSCATGLTKREYFAAMVMQGLCHATDVEGTWQHDASTVARTSVEYADALLAELERTK